MFTLYFDCNDLWHKTATHFPNWADWSKLSSILLRDTGYVEHCELLSNMVKCLTQEHNTLVTAGLVQYTLLGQTSLIVYRNTMRLSMKPALYQDFSPKMLIFLQKCIISNHETKQSSKFQSDPSSNCFKIDVWKISCCIQQFNFLIFLLASHFTQVLDVLTCDILGIG